MAVSVVMPALEMAQETGKLVSWKKKEGEQVTKGEMLLEVETDKAVVEIEAAGDGVLSGVTAKEGDVVPVGQTIAWLLKPGEPLPAGAAAGQTGRKMDAAPAAAAVAAARRGCRTGLCRRRADLAEGTPACARARRRHREVEGIRPWRRDPRGRHPEARGREHRTAQERAHLAAAPAPAPQSAAGAPPDRSRSSGAVSSIGRIMAERTTQSWTTRPALLRGSRRRCHQRSTPRVSG